MWPQQGPERCGHADEQFARAPICAAERDWAKDVKINRVFAQGDQRSARGRSGPAADAVGGEDLAKRIEGGLRTTFDVRDRPTPDSDVRRRSPRAACSGALGEDGQTRKVGTVNKWNVSKAVEESKSGQGPRVIAHRPANAIVAILVIGKAELWAEAGPAAGEKTYAAVIEELIRAKPASAKGPLSALDHEFTSTMGAGCEGQRRGVTR